MHDRLTGGTAWEGARGDGGIGEGKWAGQPGLSARKVEQAVRGGEEAPDTEDAIIGL